MILILSESNDPSTNSICNWISYFKKPFLRINESDQISIEQIILDKQIIFSFNGKRYNLIDFEKYWYRRGDFNLKPYASIKFSEKLNNYLLFENNTLKEYLHFTLNQKSENIGTFFNHEVNKLVILKLAKGAGLNIPKTIISKNFKLLGKSENYITKVLSKNISFIESKFSYKAYTESINSLKLLSNEAFGLSLFQKNILKKFEIRIFFVKDFYYSMAIFSQFDKQTETDFRRYNYSKPNRNIPFLMPSIELEKVKKFIFKTDLNTGSIDMIYGIDKKYYFLEVNPVGQFGMVSIPCNFYIEKKIADILTKV